MKRYHKQVYFPIDNDLKGFTERLNAIKWQYSKHCLDNIKNRFIDTKDLLLFIKDLTLNANDIFEYYESDYIEKACYRINYKGNIDIILIISEEKNIITIYINDTEDKHYTLNKGLYQKEE